MSRIGLTPDQVPCRYYSARIVIDDAYRIVPGKGK
jgi:hypothetical protein